MTGFTFFPSIEERTQQLFFPREISVQ
jgi:hypothetical protein